jgi:hypothetical protein
MAATLAASCAVQSDRVADLTAKRLSKNHVAVYHVRGMTIPVDSRNRNAARNVNDVILASKRFADAVRGVRPELRSMTPVQLRAATVVMSATLEATTSWGVDEIAEHVSATFIAQLPPTAARKRPVLSLNQCCVDLLSANQQAFRRLPRALRVSIIHSVPFQLLTADVMTLRFDEQQNDLMIRPCANCTRQQQDTSLRSASWGSFSCWQVTST